MRGLSDSRTNRENSLGICCRSLRCSMFMNEYTSWNSFLHDQGEVYRLPFGLCGSWSWNAELQWCTEFRVAILDGCPPGFPIFPGVQCSFLNVRLLSESDAAAGGRDRESWDSDSVSVLSAVTSQRKGYWSGRHQERKEQNKADKVVLRLKSNCILITFDCCAIICWLVIFYLTLAMDTCMQSQC